MRWILVLLVLAAIAADLIAGITGTSLTFLAGLALVYAGERLFSDDALHWVFTGGGIAVVLLAIVLRVRAMSRSEGTRRDAQRRALVFSIVAACSIPLYALTTQGVVDMLHLSDEAAGHWRGVWEAIFPIVGLVGVLPMFLIDRALALHPVTLPLGATRRTVEAGLVAALGIALVFPLNYLANTHKKEWDVAYFRVTKPGTSTLALVGSLSKPVDAYLFFPPGNSVREEVTPYFDELAAASHGQLVVHQVDQALEPKLSEDLKVRENGTIVFKEGDGVEKFKVGTDLDKAKKDLKKLDENVQKHMLKVARGARVAYLVTGHGEASSKEKDDPLHKLNLFKQLLESQNYKVKNLGVTEGLASAVPDDAAVVIIAAPEKPFLPEEEAALEAYVDRGGALMVFLDPGQERLDPLLAKLGLQAGEHSLANAKYYVPQNRGITDRVLLFSNRFGSHEAVSTLSKMSSQMAVILPTVEKLTELPDSKFKASVLIRTPEGTWEDTNEDREQQADEKSQVFNVAYAVTDKEDVKKKDDPAAPAPADDAPHFRAVVVGDVSVVADPVLTVSQGNQQLAYDALRWLVGDEDLAGTTESEEDVKVEHTKDEDVAWFYGTIFGVPVGVLALGLVITTARTNRRSK